MGLLDRIASGVRRFTVVRRARPVYKAAGTGDTGETGAGVALHGWAEPERPVRPIDMLIPVTWSASQTFPFYSLGFKFALMLAYNSDVVRATLRALIGEVFRNGIEVVRRYYKKCAVCGTEYDHDVPVCEVCGNYDRWLYPLEGNRRYLEEWIREANDNHESLIDVLSAIEWDLDVLDNAYLIVRKRYKFNENGEIIGAEPVEVLRADPQWMTLIMSRDGRLGYTMEGDKVVLVCPVHRDEVEEVPVSEYESDPGRFRCSVCGRRLYRAVAAFTRAGTPRTYFIEGEVLHVKKYTYGIGYGYPPILSLWLKIAVLLRMDYFILLGFTMQRSPRGLLIVQGVNREAFERAWRMLMEKARINPNIVYPLILERAPERGDVVRWVDLSFRPEAIDLQAYRDEVRRQIMAFYGITPVFMGEVGGAGREAMQILVTNRAIEMAQRVFNDKILPWLTRQLGVEDWVLQLRPSEMRDEERRLRILTEKLRLAEQLDKLGYKPKVVQRGFDIDITFQPKSEDEDNPEDALREAESVVSTFTGLDRLRRERERYYERREAEHYLEGMPSVEHPRAGRQRFEGEPPAPHEALEGGEGVEGGGA